MKQQRSTPSHWNSQKQDTKGRVRGEEQFEMIRTWSHPRRHLSWYTDFTLQVPILQIIIKYFTLYSVLCLKFPLQKILHFSSSHLQKIGRVEFMKQVWCSKVSIVWQFWAKGWLGWCDRFTMGCWMQGACNTSPPPPQKNNKNLVWINIGYVGIRVFFFPSSLI